MQIAGGILMRRGFSLIIAIVFVILIATIAISALSYATLTAKNTRDIYLKEQAKLLAQSATEYAVMVMQSSDYNANCPQNIKLTYPDATNPMFNIEVNLYYLDKNLEKAGCKVIGKHNSSLGVDDTNRLSSATKSAIVDVRVTSAGNVGGAQDVNGRQIDKIQYTRRTLQKP